MLLLASSCYILNKVQQKINRFLCIIIVGCKSNHTLGIILVLKPGVYIQFISQQFRHKVFKIQFQRCLVFKLFFLISIIVSNFFNFYNIFSFQDSPLSVYVLVSILQLLWTFAPVLAGANRKHGNEQWRQKSNKGHSWELNQDIAVMWHNC